MTAICPKIYVEPIPETQDVVPKLLSYLITNVVVPRQNITDHGLTVDTFVDYVLDFYTCKCLGYDPNLYDTKKKWKDLSTVFGGFDKLTEFCDQVQAYRNKLQRGQHEKFIRNIYCVNESQMLIQHLEQQQTLSRLNKEQIDLLQLMSLKVSASPEDRSTIDKLLSRP